jgi:protein-disulfide isomerase
MMEEQFPQETQSASIEEGPKTNWAVWIAAGGCLVLLCAAAFVGTLVFAGPKFVERFIPTGNVKTAEERSRVMVQGNTMGDPNAPVHIVEYSDFQCPFCQRFWSETEPQLTEEYVNSGKVYFEYRSKGSFIGEESGLAAEGAYCAGDQNKFWEYHDLLFTNLTGENVGDFSKTKLMSFAKVLDLNMEEFTSCISEGRHKRTVELDEADAEANGVSAVPTFFINGVKVEGAQPYSVLKDYIDQSLNGNSTP